MSKNQPVDPRVRLAISRWPEDAPRGTVTSFCVEHGISRKTFYVLRARLREEGPAAVLEPKSRRPSSSPTRIGEDVKDQAVAVRAALEASGLDHGPISVFDRMGAMGLESPSVAALARIFRERGVARADPKKKPRSAYRRFVYPAPNACWQLDATGYVLIDGRSCTIFQLQDDHSRLAVASLVAPAETTQAALDVFLKGVARYGVPQRLLTDNGAAMNPTRRGWPSPLVTHATGLGVQAITGKPFKPTTQGKNERFHQTLFRWLDQQPLAETISQLQAMVDNFDIIYNQQRRHQGLPGRITPQQAWDATPVAEAPKPPAAPIDVLLPAPLDEVLHPGEEPQALDYTAWGDPFDKEAGQRVLRTGSNGSIVLRRITFYLSKRRAGEHVRVIWDATGLVVIDVHGEVLIKHPWPPAGTTYVGNEKPRGRPRKTPRPE
ncbi:integrase family protein [Brachybacterium faecium DSM 4810]|uniref:Integrase family protein n=1 Tax=Brachybacterium faecium (strain ATCC 43885 / DSM 4810 / JCM 11609 / LMG 19847 / NBRC 14762 / NCIMB 9860 / 6-10) TaxID=446465 RepID=C7MHB9_BRAFD|nr:integrase family protein [Brachybacterium faecium DSM 4810]